jgi:hypothetical protein
MQGLYDYIIKPMGERYNNKVDVEGKDLILNTEVFNHQYVNRQAIVLSTPKAVKTEIKAGDIIITHHNVFRRWHDVKGVERNSRSFYKEDKYFIKHDQIFAYKIANKWRSLKGYCFIKPIKSTDKFSENNERPLVGIVKYTDGSFDIGDLVGFRPSSEYEFVIDGERLYRVFSNFITIKYEYQGDEEEYNPSWA